MAQQLYKRRNYFIDRKTQAKFMATFALASLISTVAAVSIFVFLSQTKLEKTLYTMRLPETTLADLLFREMALTTGIAVIVVILLFSYTLKKIFSRIEGPLIKLRGAILKIKGGNLRDAVALREKDEFQAFAHTLDEMKTALKIKIQVIQINSENLSRLGEGDARDNTTLTEECHSRLKTMTHELELLKL
jgi:methyl-accepting chemotaxis protein